MRRGGADEGAGRPLTTAREALVAAAGSAAELTALPARYAAAADRFLAGLLAEAAGPRPSGVALVAVGGYGRCELYPGSDVDVVLVHRQRRDADELAGHIWYAVWDDGTRLDHSVRTVREALAVARDDLRTAAGLLDARVVAGDAGLGEELASGARALVRARSRHFVAELDASVQARHAAAGDVAFLLEPDLKESHGGLRDLQALAAVAVALPPLAPSLPSEGAAHPDLAAAGAALRRTRTALHARSGRAGDRLLLELQDEVAAALELPDADVLMGLVAAAGREVAWASDDAWRHARSFLAGPRGRVVGTDRPLGRGVVLRDGEIVAPGSESGSDPTLLLRAAALSAELGAPLAAGIAAALGTAAPPLPEPWPDEARHAFLGILGGRQRAVPLLEELDRAGYLERLLPEWRAVRNRPQRNALHRFTVDRHLLETVARAGGLLRTVARPDLLLVAALLHDIGKGSPGDHTAAGTALAPPIAARMGFAAADAALVGRLVELHLLLPEAATRRDLDDPATVAGVARSVRDERTLELLAALAQADGEATGPAAWGRWKAQLVADLVERTRAALATGTAGEGAAGAGGAPRARPPRLPTALRAALAAGESGVAVAGDTTLAEVVVVAPDEVGLLAAVAGVLALHGLAVRTATAGAEDGMAVEQFTVEPGPAGLPPAAQLLADLRSALGGTLPLARRLADLAQAYAARRPPAAAPAADVLVSVDNDASGRATLVEVRAPDSRGLLHLLTAALAGLGLDVASAHVSTLGHEVVDTFYVTVATDGLQCKLTAPPDVERVRTAVTDAATAHRA